MHPRRGPPVAVIEAHQWHLQEDRKKRQPRGENPEAIRGEAPKGHPRNHGETLEAVCVEAPKGQPMIRRENLEVVCVEAPEGQPRNHRPHPNQPRRTPPMEAK